jgi:alpha-beta hydrolase superfamily lysophospholipase
VAAFEESSVTLPDGYDAYARWWQPREPRGAVLYHHGIQSHCGWYEGSAARLFDQGFAVLQVDRRGCGRNASRRGHAESADQLVNDSLAASDNLRKRSGFREHHVVGVSWGGKLAVAAYIAAPGQVLSLSLVTPGLFPLVGVSKAEKARIGLAMLYEPTKSFEIPLNDAELFTGDPRWRSFIDADPLTLRHCTAGFYLASRRMDRMVDRLRGAPSVPVHLLLAGDERIIDNDHTTDFLRSLHWTNCRITRYRQARHALEFDTAPDEYFADLCAFLSDVDVK